MRPVATVRTALAETGVPPDQLILEITESSAMGLPEQVRQFGVQVNKAESGFLMIVALVPFALGPDLNLLSRIGPAILWLAAVLATLIGLDRLFQADDEDGEAGLAGQGAIRINPIERRTQRPHLRPGEALAEDTQHLAIANCAAFACCGDQNGLHPRDIGNAARSVRRI